MKRILRGPGLYIVIILVIILMSSAFNYMSSSDSKNIEYDTFREKVMNGEVLSVVITERDLVGLYNKTALEEKDLPNTYDFKTYLPPNDTFQKDMAVLAAERTGKNIDEITTADYGFKMDYQSIPEQPWFLSFLPYIIILIVLVVFWYFMMQQSQGGGGKVMSFGKSRARMNVDEKRRVTFEDVAGAQEEKEELKEVVDFLRSPKRFLDLGARIPKGVLLVGPPGTGKTLLAKAVAGEAGVPFFSISGSDFVEMFVGVGASRVRDLFETAKKNSPCIVFIDEIDAVGRQRGAGLGGGHDEREQTLNQLLVEMDGFVINEGIIIIAATNRPDILDPALLRPGRFDRQITVHVPDVRGREEILRVHSRGKPLAEEVSLKVLAKRTPYFTGADLENVMNEAAILTARRNKQQVSMKELEEAITRVVAGPEKRSRVVTEKDKRIVSFHEAGHAMVGKMLENCDPVHEVSIIPRGQAAGYTLTLPKEETQFSTRSKLLDEIAMLLGGRVAEAITMHEITTGAKNDIQRATEIARRMVVEFGMSDDLGPVYLAGDTEIFIGRDLGHQKNHSEEVGARIDHEIKRIVNEAYARAQKVITENMEGMNRVVESLLERERLDAEEFEILLQGGTLPPFEPEKVPDMEHKQTVEAEHKTEKAVPEGQIPHTEPAGGKLPH